MNPKHIGVQRRCPKQANHQETQIRRCYQIKKAKPQEIVLLACIHIKAEAWYFS